jgi:hypothetical protein
MALLAGPDAAVNSQLPAGGHPVKNARQPRRLLQARQDHEYDVIINVARHGLSALQNGGLKQSSGGGGRFSYAEKSDYDNLEKNLAIAPEWAPDRSWELLGVLKLRSWTRAFLSLKTI